MRSVLIIAAALLGLSAGAAFAQSSPESILGAGVNTSCVQGANTPGWGLHCVPTFSYWETLFSAKQDYNAAAPTHSLFAGPASGGAGPASFRTPLEADLAPGLPGGTINLFRNGRFDIWQRTTSVFVASGLSCSASLFNCMTADGWAVIPTGGGVTVTQGAAPASSGSLWSLLVTGSTGNSDAVIKQRLSANVAAAISPAGVPTTIQFLFRQTTGAPLAPQISTCAPTSSEAFASCVADLSPTAPASCPSGQWCMEALTFTPSANSAFGYEISIDCQALTASQTCAIANADIRASPGASPGVPANPPPVELRPAIVEWSICSRYLTVLSAGGVANAALGAGYVKNATSAFAAVQFAPQRTTPTVAFSSAGNFEIVNSAGNYAASAISATNVTPFSATINLTISGATTGGGILRDSGSGSAQIVISSEL